jgi:hypothetical protein
MARRRSSSPSSAVHLSVVYFLPPIAIAAISAMKALEVPEMKVVALLLIVLGVLGLAYGGITWTRKDKVVDIGPVEITADKTERLPLPPIAGAICLAVGAGLLLTGRRST